MDSAFLHDQEQAVLISPVLDQQDWSCARLVYQITGRGSLQLHLRPDGDNFDYRLWTASKASDSWLIASVDLPNTTIPYQVGLATKTGSIYCPSMCLRLGAKQQIPPGIWSRAGKVGLCSLCKLI